MLAWAVRSTTLSGSQCDEEKDLKLFRKPPEQGSINIFFQGPNSKYSRFTDHLVFVMTIQLCSGIEKAINNVYVNEYGCVPIKFYL